MNLDQIMLACLPVMEKAGEMAKANWNKPHETRHKGPVDLVTETDVAVENFLRGELARIVPEAVFVGEESGSDPASLQKLCWVVDPIDGTTNFVHRIPIIGISVALCDGGVPVLGIINSPMLGEMYYAAMDSRAFCNGEPIAVSQTSVLRQSLVATGFPYDVGEGLPQILGRLGRVIPATQGLRRPGAASMDLAWVACGRLDAFYEAGLKPWDMAAGWIITERAGGRITAFDGTGVGLGGEVLATNGLVHEQMAELLALGAESCQ